MTGNDGRNRRGGFGVISACLLFQILSLFIAQNGSMHIAEQPSDRIGSDFGQSYDLLSWVQI